jgi:hypothetical protein
LFDADKVREVNDIERHDDYEVDGEFFELPSDVNFEN